ncbi:LysR family transcriptional regulator [Streptomyces sp. NPDC001093]|uniref:LysR family transcriptional regulator n=1 Tax=Streptomyces sp. NPDC001093 TaxID=3154376 RepID=UPI00332F0D90
MNDLEVRQLRYFVAVAEELHFGRAAERLGMAQPPLSRAIRQLERQLGVRLLERTTRQVRLTAAGEVFLRDARTALDAVTAAGRRARHAGRPVPRLRLALRADYDAGLLPQILTAYQGEVAATPVELVMSGKEQAQALRDGRADVALLYAPFDDRGLDVEVVLTEPGVVVLAAADPLASRSCLRLADLADRSLPDGTPADQIAGLRSLGMVTRDGQDQPQTVQRGLVTQAPPTAMNLAQIFKLIEVGSVVFFLPASVARRYSRPGVAYQPVSDLPAATLAVAWPQESHSPAVAAFVRVATAVAAAAQAEAGTPQRHD